MCCSFDSANGIVEGEAWRYTFDEDGNMVERRCEATLLAQTEGVAGPLPARSEVNPRAELAQASWSLPGKDQVQSVKRVFFSIRLRSLNQYYSSFVLSLSNYYTFYTYASREHEKIHILYYRKRLYEAHIGIFISREPLKMQPSTVFQVIWLGMWPYDYIYALNNPIRYIDPFGLTAECNKQPCPEKCINCCRKIYFIRQMLCTYLSGVVCGIFGTAGSIIATPIVGIILCAIARNAVYMICTYKIYDELDQCIRDCPLK